MKYLRSFVTLLFLVFTTSAWSAPYIAEIVKVRGKVTQLAPGSWTPRVLREGDKIKEDTSIRTPKRGFVRIKFVKDGSTLSLGPDSKALIVQVQKQKGSVIALLKGTLRTKVEKQEDKEKFIVRSGSAAMGVRGTEFTAVYNPENRVTSLLTYKGEVAMIKDKLPSEVLKNAKKHEKDYVRDEHSNKIEVKRKHVPEKFDNTSIIKRLDSNEAVVVKRGQFSGTVESMGTVSQPVKISPVQLNVLYKNTEMVEKNRRSELKKAKLEITEDMEEELVLKPAEQEAPLEGSIDHANNKYAPKAGGIIDMESGLYIPPTEDSQFDVKEQVFVSNVEKTGTVDADTGQYIAPRGLRLHNKKGFIVVKTKGKKYSADEKEILFAKANEMNKTIARDAIISDEEESVQVVTRSLTQPEYIAKDTISFMIGPLNYEFENKNSTISRPASRSYKSDSGKIARLRWEHSAGLKWQPLTSFTLKSVEFSESTKGNTIMQSGTLAGFDFGIRRNLTEKWNFMLVGNLEQDLFLNHQPDSNNVQDEIIRVALPKLKFALEGKLVMGDRYSLDLDVYASIIARKKTGSFTVKQGYNYGLKVAWDYWFSRKYWLELALFSEQQQTKVENINFEADVTHSVSAGLLQIAGSF